MTLDNLIIEFDKGLRTVLAEARRAPVPDRDKPERPGGRKTSCAAMRINHGGLRRAL